MWKVGKVMNIETLENIICGIIKKNKVLLIIIIGLLLYLSACSIIEFGKNIGEGIYYFTH